MKTATRRPQVGRWFFQVRVERDFLMRDGFYRRLRVAVVRFKHEPPEAAVPVPGRDYAGFIFQLAYRVPAYVEAWR